MYTQKIRSSSSDTVGIIAAVVVAFIVIVSALIVVNGWVVMIIWNWFVPEIFPTMPELTIGSAIAIALVVSVLTNHDHDYNSNDLGLGMNLFTVFILRPGLVLIMGLIVRVIWF